MHRGATPSGSTSFFDPVPRVSSTFAFLRSTELRKARPPAPFRALASFGGLAPGAMSLRMPPGMRPAFNDAKACPHSQFGHTPESLSANAYTANPPPPAQRNHPGGMR